MDKRYGPIFLSVVGIAALVLFLFYDDPELKYDWRPYQALRSEQPYGHRLFLDLLEASSDAPLRIADEPIGEAILKDSSRFNYVFVGQANFITSDEADLLLEEVYGGSNALIVCNEVPQAFKLLLAWNYDFLIFHKNDSVGVEVSFLDSNYEETVEYHFEMLYADTPVVSHWSQFHDITFWDSVMVYSQTTPLGYLDNRVNFAKYSLGDGAVYFHLNPRLFVNVYMRTEDGRDYANGVLSHLPDARIIVDRRNRMWRPEAMAETESKSVLKYIFSQDALRHAWYVVMFAVLLFLLFRTKRRQRIVPIQASVENTSIEFARALGTLYYQASKPRYLVSEMMKLFHTFNRRRYGIQPAKKKGAANTELIAKRSKVDEEMLREIFEMERKLTYNDYAKFRDIVPLFEALKSYYKHARK